MSGKKGARVNLAVLVQVFDNGPGNAQAVEGASATAEFVDEEQAAAGGVVEDIGGLVHLHHKGALAAGEVVGRAHTGEDAIDDADGSLARGDEAAHLRHQRDETHLADDGALAGHIRAGDEHDLRPVGVEAHIVGHEAARAELALDDRVAAVADFDPRAVVNLGPGVGFALGDFGERIQHVDAREGTGDLLDLGRPASGAVAQG